MKPVTIIALLTCCLLTACHKSAPEIPWENFDRYHIDEKLSEKGPYNNYRITFWKADSGTFRAEVLADFAAKYGWKFTKEEKADTPALSFAYIAYRAIYKNKNAVLPRWFKDSCIIYEFKPPSKMPKPRFSIGYDIFLSRDKSQMCIFNVEW